MDQNYKMKLCMHVPPNKSTHLHSENEAALLTTAKLPELPGKPLKKLALWLIETYDRRTQSWNYRQSYLSRTSTQGWGKWKLELYTAIHD